MSVNVRALTTHFSCLGVAGLLWAAAPTTFCSPEALGKPSSATLTFAERLAYQWAIEEVRWGHRIWPKENPRPKPPLQAIISAREIEQKVKDYLRKSQLIANERGRPITASELQAEMGRMAKHTKQPDVLRELFAALGNDPFVIAECLARPIIAERLVGEFTSGAKHASFRAKSRNPAARLIGGSKWIFDYPQDDIATNLNNAAYKLPEITAPLDCADDTWTPTTTVNAPDVRADHTAVWTGSEMIAWGGYNHVSILNTGAKYDPAEDVWTATSTVNAPTGRVAHTAVWTGSEMIIWGGQAPSLLNTGGRYNPASDSWTATSTLNAPTPRIIHTAVWTGGQMIVWGGRNGVGWFNTGGRYDPSTDSWTASSTINAPEARYGHTAEWTGSKMIVWAGTNQTIYLNTGGRYDPTADSWAATGIPTDVLGRVGHSAVWTGGEMIVWGGTDSTFNDCNTGGRYSPSTDSWMTTSLANAPSARDSHTAVWTGAEMIAWGGGFCCPEVDFNTGGRYNAGTDTWVATSTADSPLARVYHTAVWIGSDMVVWGGYNIEADIFLNTGGRYCAAAPAPTPTPTSSPTPTPTFTPTPTPTATATATPTPTATSTPRPTLTPRSTPPPRPRPTPPPRP